MTTGESQSARIQRLSQDHPWMPTQTLGALASSGLSDKDLFTVGEQIRQAAVSLGAGATGSIKSIYQDPVLQKRPSAALALREYLSGAIGETPNVQGDPNVRLTQHVIKLAGFGADLPTDGTWTPDWEAARKQYGEAVYQKQQSGNKSGGLSFGGALDKLSAFNLTDAGDAIIGFVKGLPADFRQLASDLALGAGQLGYAATHGVNPTGQEATRAAAPLAASVSNIADQTPVSPGDYYKQLESMSGLQQAGRIVSNAGTGLLVFDGLGAIGKVGSALGYGTTAAAEAGVEGAAGATATLGRAVTDTAPAALATDEATRAGGVITSSAIPAADTSDAATMAGQFEPKPGAIAKTVQRVSDSHVYQNIPILGRTGPVISSLADADGAYYAARRLVSPMYRFAQAADEGSVLGKAGLAAGTAVGESSLLGAKVRATAAASQLGGGDTQLSSSVQGEHTLDTVNDSIKKKLKDTPLGGWLDLNSVMFALHGPAGGTGSLSAHLGSDLSSAQAAASHIIGNAGFKDIIRKATGLSWEKQASIFGGDDRATKFWANKLTEHAASFEAQDRWNRYVAPNGIPVSMTADTASQNEADDLMGRIYDLGSNERQDFLAGQFHDIMGDKGQALAALRRFRGQGPAKVIESIKNDITNTRIKGARATGISPTTADSENWLRGYGSTYMDASDIVSHDVLQHLKTDGALKDASPERSNIGLASDGTLGRKAAYTALNDFETEYNTNMAAQKQFAAAMDNAGTSVDGLTQEVADGVAKDYPVPPHNWHTDWNDRVDDFLYKRLGIDAAHIPHVDTEKLAAGRDRAGRLAVEVEPGVLAPPELLTAIDHLHEKGYHLVSGTNIGFLHANPSPLDDLGKRLGPIRRTLMNAGINPDIIPSEDIGSAQTDGVRNRIQDWIDSGAGPQHPGWDADTWLAYLREIQGQTKPSRAEGALMGLFQGIKTAGGKYNVDKYAADIRSRTTGLSDDEIHRQAVAAAEAAVVRPLQLRDIPRKQFVDALANTSDVNTASAEEVARSAGGKFEQFAPGSQARVMRATGVKDYANQPFLTEGQANSLYGAVRQGYADVPAQYLGLSKIEDVIRAPMGFAGKGVWGGARGAAIGAGIGVASDPNDLVNGNYSKVVGRAAVGGAVGAMIGSGTAMLPNLPNRYVQLRNKGRFELNPYFSARRLVKTEAKLVLEGISPTSSPMATMRSAGSVERSRDALERVLPAYKGLREQENISDAADRFLQQSDVFGYSHRDYEAYAAGEWEKAGLTDDQIHQKLIRVFGYGKNTQEGRSALERSMNFTFFPFSFDKTLYRNVGSYLIDNAGQRIILQKSLAAYDQFNKDHGDSILSTGYWQKHLPILEEATRVNAFYHGLSLGEFGGINAPLLNLFLPQSWTSSQGSYNLLTRFIPSIKDFQRIYAEANQQKQIAVTEARNITKSTPDTIANPQKASETQNAQLTDAFAMQRSWNDYYKDVLKYNFGTKRAQQITFADIKGVDPKQWGNFATAAITKANIANLVKQYYPAFSSTKGASIAIEKQSRWDNYVLSRATSPGYQQALQDWTTNVNKWASRRSDTDISDGQKEQITTALRSEAMQFAAQDADFYRLYGTTYEGVLGPLEKLN